MSLYHHKRVYISYGRLITSPIFLREINTLENNYSDKKQRFDTSIIIGCAKRCRFNHVQVITCAPFSFKSGGRPFPTSFWLTCPYLIKQAGRIESHGGVSELEEYIKSKGLITRWGEYNMLHQVIRSGLLDDNSRKFIMRYRPSLFRSLMRGGVGGIKYKAGEVNAKCLHLQTASFMALNFHPAEDWLKSQSLCGDCGGSVNCCCKDSRA